MRPLLGTDQVLEKGLLLNDFACEHGSDTSVHAWKAALRSSGFWRFIDEFERLYHWGLPADFSRNPFRDYAIFLRYPLGLKVR